MPFSIGLLLLACGASAWLAYGIDPRVARQFGGLELICLTRRLQWVLVIAAVLPCVILIVRVVLGRSRAWWMIGLSVVLAMLFVRFGPGTVKPVRVLDGEAMLTIAETALPNEKMIGEDEFVVGFDFGEQAYALPYRCLVRTPIVQLTDFDRRLLVVASPLANLVSVIEVSRQSRAEDYDYVAAPGNSTLVYNRKNGEFIVGVTGRTEIGRVPAGVIGTLPCHRMTLRQWRAARPASRLMTPTDRDMRYPGVPLGPLYPPAVADASLPPNTPVTLLHVDPPLAVLASEDTSRPIHLDHPRGGIVLWRDGFFSRAFARSVGPDASLTFDRKGEKYADRETGSTWTGEGRCVDGKHKGRRLTPVRADDNVYWGVCKEWWPGLKLARPTL